jgi:hypothetical protein
MVVEMEFSDLPIRGCPSPQAPLPGRRAALSRGPRGLLELLDENKTSSPAQREFIRRVDRLRRSQLHQLRTIIFERGALDQATCKLDEIYGRYVTAAMSLP